MDAGNRKQPGQQIPSRQKHADASPGIHSTVDAATRIDRLHPTHSDLVIDLREALGHGGIVQVEEFDAATGIETTDAIRAGAAEIAGTVVKNG